MPPTSYATTPLYGGAITAKLPSDYLDASDLRQVPDTQEVRLSRTSLTSVVVDILERAQPPAHPCHTDEEALDYHYRDVVSNETRYVSQREREQLNIRRTEGAGEEEKEKRVWERRPVAMGHLEGVPAWTITATQHPVRPAPQANGDTDEGGEEEQTVDFTGISLTLVRLREQKTDILIAVNAPYVRGEYDAADVDLREGKLGTVMKGALEVRDEILGSFTVVDWGLFVDE